MNPYAHMDREGLARALEMFAKLWLAHDGCWFLAAEARAGLASAMDLDAAAWARFAVAEARRIQATFGVPGEPPLEALARALSHRMYALLNAQRLEWSEDRSELTFVMETCRVQEARRRKGLPDFPCRAVGEVEFGAFAGAVDPGLRTTCRHCPPDSGAGGCAWSFRLAPAP